MSEPLQHEDRRSKCARVLSVLEIFVRTEAGGSLGSARGEVFRCNSVERRDSLCRVRSYDETTCVTHVVLRTVFTLTFGVFAFACRAIPRSESYVTFRHTGYVTLRHTATADNSSHGSDAVRERVRSHAARSACGVE
jgi:hypothetical protein